MAAFFLLMAPEKRNPAEAGFPAARALAVLIQTEH